MKRASQIATYQINLVTGMEVNETQAIYDWHLTLNMEQKTELEISQILVKKIFR